jgi:hypothetical protein
LISGLKLTSSEEGLRKAKQKVGAAAVLREGQKRQSLLAKQREVERDLAQAIVNEWHGAVATLVTKLSTADQVITAA